MAAINKELKERLAKIDTIRSELKKAEKSAAKDIMSLLQSLMKENPLLIGMRWQQYTPSFNDGDVCEFGVHGPEFKFADSVNPQEAAKDKEDEDYYDESWVDGGDYGSLDNDWFNEKADILNHKEVSALKKAVKAAEKVFSKLEEMDSQLQTMFGDGYQITVTADGVETEEYGHD